MTLILNESQAEAVYSAMCALNNVGGTLRTFFGSYDNGQQVEESIHRTGIIQVFEMGHGVAIRQEKYSSQSAFGIAYGLQ